MINQAGFWVLVPWAIVFAQVDAVIGQERPIVETDKNGVRLNVGPFQVQKDRLDLCFEITNNSKQEIWVCDDIDVNSPVDCETVASLDGSTLMIRLRLGLPIGWWRSLPLDGKYVRLAGGQHYVASLWYALPMRLQPVLTSRRRTRSRGAKAGEPADPRGRLLSG